MSDALTSACASRILEIIGGVADSGRYELTSRQPYVGQKDLEQILQVLIQTSSNQYGASSEQTIQYQKALSDFYTATGQEVLSAPILDRLHDMAVGRWGQHSTQAHSINEELVATLQKVSIKGTDTMHFASKLYILAQQTMDATDSRRIAATFRMVSGLSIVRGATLPLAISHR